MHNAADFKKRVWDVRGVIGKLSVQFRDQNKNTDKNESLSCEYEAACEYLFRQQRNTYFQRQQMDPDRFESLHRSLADRFYDVSYIDREVAPELIYLSGDLCEEIREFMKHHNWFEQEEYNH